MSPIIGSLLGDSRFTVLAVLTLGLVMYVACLALSGRARQPRVVPIRRRREHGNRRAR